MIVVDTNVIVNLLFNTEHTASSEALLAKDSNWVAPSLWRSEFRNVLALYLRKEMLGLEDAIDIMLEAQSLMAGREYEVASAEVLSLAASSSCSAYDCEFVALAGYLQVPLVTNDRQLHRRFPSVAVPVIEFLRSH